MLREQNLAQRVRGREMGGAHVEGAWLFLKCKEKSPEALEQACDLICIFKRRLYRVENALQYVCVLGGGGSMLPAVVQTAEVETEVEPWARQAGLVEGKG